MKDLKEKTLRGGLAKICSQGGNFIVRVGSLMVLARLLDPRDFGLVGMVAAVTGAFSLFKDAGLSIVTIQRPSITNEQVSALFWINMLVGVVLGALSAAIAPVVVSLYHEPRLFWVTIALATGFLFSAAGVQHSALLQREMRFITLAIIESLALLVSAIIGIGMAISGWGYWSLVGMSVSLPAASTLGVWLMKGWVPGMPQWCVGIGSMVRFGGLTTLNGFVVYLSYNLEKILIGRVWGAEALGIYGRAYQLINIPTENLNSASGGVVLSALSRLQGDSSRFKNYFLKGYSLLLALTLPITIGCALFAKDIILILLGPKWKEAVPIFQLLCPTILAFGLINPLAWLLYSVGKVGRSLKVSLVLAVVVMTAYVVGLPYGPTGVAFGYSAVMTLWLIPHIAWCIQGTMISVRDILRVAGRPFVSSLVAGILGFGVHLLCIDLSSPFLRLVLAGSVLIGVYAWMLLYVMGQKDFYLEMLRALRRRASNGARREAVALT